MVTVMAPRIKWIQIATLLASTMAAAPVSSAEPFPQLRAYEVEEDWRQPIAPLQLAAGTWQIGTVNLTSLLLIGDEGAILIDGGMPQAAEHLLGNIGKLGLQPSDLKLILISHAHADHAGPLAAIKRATGARLAANAESALLLAVGGANDLQYGDRFLYPPVSTDQILHDGETVKLGNLTLQVHFTPGHTPGSMSWTWTDSSADGTPLRIAYADSLGAAGYSLRHNARTPQLVTDFRNSFQRVASLPCDLLLTPHPGLSGLRYGKTLDSSKAINCRQYADAARRRFEAQLPNEQSPR